MACNNNHCCRNSNNRGSNNNNVAGVATVRCPEERICIQVNKVFDACICQFADEDQPLRVAFSSPVNTFLGGESTVPVIVSNVVITPQAESVCSRVQCTISVPMNIYGQNASGETILGRAVATFDKDILLRVPQEALIPAQVQCTANIVAMNGKFKNGGEILKSTLCTTLIIKIVAPVEVLINSAGHPALPPCQDFSEDICEGVFERPIYPV